MRRIIFSITIIYLALLLIINGQSTHLGKELDRKELSERTIKETINKITDIVRPSDTLETIFEKHRFKRTDLSEILRSARGQFNLSKLRAGNSYIFETDKNNNIRSMEYAIDDFSFLKVAKLSDGFRTEKKEIEYDKKIGSLFINIKNNLISSMPGSHNENLRLALELSDIYAWDIDFFSDLRNGDSVKVVLEELWLGNKFKGFGNVLAAEFLNRGKLHKAYRFEYDGSSDYFDADGKSLKKALLKSPLKFSRISSYFNKSRFHPILRTYRPHLGIDYAAPAGTPVSAAGNGVVLFSGYQGEYGQMIRIKHSSGFQTYYGHLSSIAGGIRQGEKVSQGDIIGYVGQTGLATGPHLDYRIKINDRFVNPLTVAAPQGESIPKAMQAKFRQTIEHLNIRLASANKPSSEKKSA
ncbi:MAG: peptidoglycan-specific endopeptidase, family [Nitrospirae bacterium]|nr:peptidoglycan-specific endopeptidase, family [Nitrospirota bacterium]